MKLIFLEFFDFFFKVANIFWTFYLHDDVHLNTSMPQCHMVHATNNCLVVRDSCEAQM